MCIVLPLEGQGSTQKNQLGPVCRRSAQESRPQKDARTRSFVSHRLSSDTRWPSSAEASHTPEDRMAPHYPESGGLKSICPLRWKWEPRCQHRRRAQQRQQSAAGSEPSHSHALHHVLGGGATPASEHLLTRETALFREANKETVWGRNLKTSLKLTNWKT